MAIRFARVEFVKRSSGKNACAKAAYISRSKVEFHGNNVSKANMYDWSYTGALAFHEIVLPSHVDGKFKDLTSLWNEAESKEVRSNSQVAMELVLALPDDHIVTVEDRIQLTKTFVQEHFVDKGLAAQIAIHPPERRFYVTGDSKELGLKKGMIGHVVTKTDNDIRVKLESGEVVTFNSKEFTGFIEKEHNWHAHVLLPTRRFKDNGLEFDDKKARDMMPRVNLGRVVAGPDWGKLWAEHQNKYFQERGLALQVDQGGIIPQEHLGPYRMRARAFSLFEEHHRRIEENQVAATNPEKILEAITTYKSVFTKSDLEQFLAKHSPTEAVETVTIEFWKLPQLVQLVDKKTAKPIPKYTSQLVIEEEQQILRLTDRLISKEAFPIKPKHQQPLDNLQPEQLEAYKQILQGQRLSLIHGYAGTGKSHVLKALQTSYEQEGYQVRAFGPDSSTTDVLKEKELSHTENVYRFLFAVHHNRRKILNGKEVWILDEAGKLGNRPLLEFMKEANKRNAQVILAGDTSQLPPIERGGMFKAICDRYGAHQLIDIQRQKDIKQREIVHNMAVGDYGAAIDKLSSTKGLIWAESKKESMEELVMRWAQDTRANPKSSTLIIAHSNSEVRVLNEMVRLIRKQRGELGEKEFQCMTFQGNVFISIGDRIEFRRNDHSLGVSNGLSGVLVEAERNRFVIAVEDGGKKKQTVVFDPAKYHAFQLGYASTYYRSQGRTIDRAYVLHSQMLNKQMFYVGLTRHVKNVSYFLSKDEVYCLSDLKRLSTRTAEKDLTVEFTTQRSINQQQGIEQRQLQIQDLIGSSSLLNRMKGYGLATWDKITSKTTDFKERIQDRLPNEAFYQPPIPIFNNSKFPVLEVSELTHINDKIYDGKIMKYSHIDHETLKTSPKLDPKVMDKFSPDLKDKFKDYCDKAEMAATFKEMVDVEAENTAKDVRLTSYFRQRQETCGARNRMAHTVFGGLSSDEKRSINPRMLAMVQEQAQRYEAFLARQDRSTKHSLEAQLKDNMASLLHKLYPEGPTGRDRTNFRFGNKGSLSVAHSGSKAGQFYDFEQQIGGGLLKLIQRELGFGEVEARGWAQHFLSQSADISIPASFSMSAKESKAEDTWVPLKPVPEFPAPSLDNLKGKKLSLYFDEVSRHAYRDVDGQILYYVLRLHDKQDPKKKITPPLSYGYWKSKPEQIGWELKGYKCEHNHLYNLHLLKQNPKATILIVEGEKTADLALSKLPGKDYICMTWPGGAGAVSKADWTPLIGRKVQIWPDNDQVGYQAGEKACQELKKVGVESLHLINVSDLKKHFPEKWDLADPIPHGVSKELPEKLIAKAVQKGINPEQAILRLSLDTKNLTERSRINEILWRVDERIRPELEEKHVNQPWKVQDEILKETQRLFLNQEKQKVAFRDKFGIDSKALESLTYQVCLAQAKRGTDLRLNEVEVIKDTIQNQGYLNVPKTVEKDVAEIHRDRALSKSCAGALEGMDFKAMTRLKNNAALQAEQIERQITQVKALENTKQTEVLKQVDLGMKL